jgi:uncharacterized protein YcbX
MPITVKAIHTAPVKSLALQSSRRVSVDFRGIAEDRRFYLINERGRLLTQREVGRLTQVQAEYTPEPELLRLRFPDGRELAGEPQPGRAIGTMVWDRRVRGHILEGDWSEALSEFCGQPVSLVKSDAPGQAFDEFPISILSQASVDYLEERAGGEGALDHRRFRPSLLLQGGAPHQEDSWLGGRIQIGPELRLIVAAPDPRCAIITQDPSTGRRDLDLLRLILDYRPSPRNAYFGVYGLVEQPGMVSVGDHVTVLAVP